MRVGRAIACAETLALSLTLALAACGKAPDAPIQPVVLPPTPSASVDAAIAVVEPDAGPADPPDAPSIVAFVRDGTLLVIGRRTLLARAPDGTTHRKRLDDDAQVEFSDHARGAVIVTKDLVELVATPSLATIFHGAGDATIDTRTALVVDDGTAVVFQQGDALMRLALPPERHGTRVNSITTIANGARINVAYETDTDGFAGTLFDAKSGAIVGPGYADRGGSYAPLSGVSSDAIFIVKGDRLSRVDALTGKVTRGVAIGCGKDRVLANPTPSPRGDIVLVTCNDEGIVLDGVTLKSLRRISRILPGCDNGMVLGGVVLPDNHTLLLSGCGGEAKIDLTTGRYTCGDGGGIVGAPYEMVPSPVASTATRTPPVPLGRERLARCTKENQTATLGSSGRFRLEYGEQVTIQSDGAKPLVIEDGSTPTIAPDEKSFAYVKGAIVVVRALPGGEPIAEVRLGGK